MQIFGLILLGLLAGSLSGFLGIGGATILIPVLILIFRLSQHLAQGTSIAALLFPVGMFAAIKYWQAGNVNIKFAFFIALGFIVGGYIGAVFVQPVPDEILKKVFGIYLLLIAIYLLVFK